ncbi:Calcineurin-like phosphoesterase [Algoriphagus faecimaris]|uniref:Calcineurin-like phosphoesterase n=1 Tax=Algoriphagus faecimaris TaxID=686796 RepID=A0A1G6W133_9BACT|nr:metallophosphoesterase [Algoriphagus faecimaris]SDD59529.1 Calcineurin-like phosphoesterase [Algoriphagus faecimaris]
MQRRPFLQKISLLSSSIMTMPFLLYGKMDFPKKTKIKFITASDGHYGQPNTDFENSHRQLIEALNQEKDLDFVVFNGDLIHDDPKWMSAVKKVYDQLSMPYFTTKGNHDRVSLLAWEQIWGRPSNFSFIHQNQVGIILLDCSNEKGDYLCADLEFAQSKLEEYKVLDQVFVFIHISQNDWTRHGIACSEFLDLVTSFPNVKATFHGHDHDIDGQMLYQKKPFLWSGHFGGSWGNPFPSYRVCEIGEDGKIATYLKTVKDGMILNGHNL